MDVKSEVIQAEQRIRKYIRVTPLEYSEPLSRAGQNKTYLKLENLQVTGSFKARGALSKILSLSPDEKAAGVVTASTGNHGLGVANALAQTGTKGVVYLPHNASPAKAALIKDFNIPVEFYGENSAETEIYARRSAGETGQTYISPYNDRQVIGGQGTIGVELLRELPEVDYILVAVGGGGLISGIAGYAKAINPHIEIIGCLPENAPAMYDCIKAGKIIEVPESPTLSDGTAGGLDEDSITLALCQKYVDDYILVSEAEIAEGMRFIYKHHGQIIEGSAGVAVAAFLRAKHRFKEKSVALIMCGGNVSPEKFQKILDEKHD